MLLKSKENIVRCAANLYRCGANLVLGDKTIETLSNAMVDEKCKDRDISVVYR
jgi:hypothetical protein